jgi:ribosomal protein L35AE/L33A
VQISQSASQRLSCHRYLNQSIVDTHSIEVLVNEGSEVDPDDPVMIVLNGAVDANGNPTNRLIRTRNLPTKATVKDVKRTQTHILGEPAERVRIKYECVYTMTDGDKLTTRHGNKGVVKVVADREMPDLPDGRTVEVLIHPFSFIGRRPHGALREMMLNEMATRQGQPIRVKHFSDWPSMRDLVSLGFGKKTQLTLKGWELPLKTFVGQLYFLRLDMHAREQVSSCGLIKPKNFHGLNPDAGKVSGQRINLGMATVMHAKGLKETHRMLHIDNIERGAIRMVEDYMSVLAFKGQRRTRRG